MAAAAPPSPGGSRHGDAFTDSLNRRLAPSSTTSASSEHALLLPELESGLPSGALKVSRGAIVIAVATSVLLLLLTATSYSAVHSYRTEYTRVRLEAQELQKHSQQLQERSKQMQQHKEELAKEKAELDGHRAGLEQQKALHQKQQHLMEQHRNMVNQHQREELFTKLPEVEDFDRKAAATSPVGQLLANLAAAGQDVRKLERKLGTVLSWKHNLPVPDLIRSNAFMGNGARLRRVVRDLLAGDKEIRIGVVGGSISWGHGASNAPVNGWFGLFASYLEQAFPRAKVIRRNGAIPATSAAYTYMCLELAVDEQVDLLFIEFTMNDGFEEAIADNSRVKVMERLVRKAMGKPHAPAVALMQVVCQNPGYDGKDWNPQRRPFHITLEDLYGAVSHFYDQPWLSVRDATWRYVTAPPSNATDPNDSSTWSFYSFWHDDNKHPNDLGNKFMADMAVHMVQRTALELLATRPWTRADELELSAGLPQPMYPGNYGQAGKLCAHQEDLKPFVKVAKGWEFVAEGSDPTKPKYGYVATQPGSELVLEVDTRQSDVAPDRRVNLMIAFLRSYEHMGVARVICLGGCNCAGRDINGHQEGQRESTTHLHKIEMTQHERCQVLLTITDATSSGEHKFKVSGIIMQDEAAASAGVFLGDGLWLEGRHHKDTEVGRRLVEEWY